MGRIDERGATHHRGDIQGLRAVAVLLVVLGHAGVPLLPGGYVGVDVFFVVSGFLITGILLREAQRSGRVSLLGFYARRARRILPAAVLVLVVTVLVAGQLLSPIRADQVLKHAIWAALFGANLHSAREGTDYFAETSFVSPLEHFWSLAVEEQFYLIWPALIALLLYRRHTGAQAASGLGDNTRRRIVVAVAVLSTASLAWSIIASSNDPRYYFTVTTRAWELGLGAILALTSLRLPAAVRALASWIGLAAIGVAAMLYTSATPFPGYHALLPTIGAALVLAGGPSRYGAALVLDRQPMRRVGDISYSLYLWHWPFLVLAEAYAGRNLDPPELVVVLLAAVAMSVISYLYVETPVRQSRPLARRQLRSLAMWPAAALLVVSAGCVPRHDGGQPAWSQTTSNSARPTDRPSQTAHTGQPANAAAHSAELARRAAPLPREIRPSLEQLWNDVAKPPPDCGADRDQVEHRLCELGAANRSRTIVLFGDSHVAQWMDPIVRAAKAKGYRVVPVLKASCHPAEVTFWRIEKQRPYTECDTWRQWAFRTIGELKPARIILAGFISVPLADTAAGKPIPAADDEQPFAAGATETLRKLRAITPHVSVISGTTTLEQEPLDCLGNRRATRATCSEPLDSMVSERNRALKRAAAKTGARYIDVIPWLCDPRTCPLVIDDVVVYRDNNHITRTYAETIGPALLRKLDL